MVLIFFVSKQQRSLDCQSELLVTEWDSETGSYRRLLDMMRRYRVRHTSSTCQHKSKVHRGQYGKTTQSKVNRA